MATAPTDGTDTTTPEPTLRDEIDAAFAQHATDESGETAPEGTTTGDRARDEQGRFAPKATAQEEDPAAQAPGATPSPCKRPQAPSPHPRVPRPLAHALRPN